MSKRCSSGQRVCVGLDFFGSFCVKTKRTLKEAIEEKLAMIKGRKLAMKKRYGFMLKKSELL